MTVRRSHGLPDAVDREQVDVSGKTSRPEVKMLGRIQLDVANSATINDKA
jgi:hypothetical protein